MSSFKKSFKINLDIPDFFLDIVCDDVEEEFIYSYHGQFKKVGSDTVYPKLYWQMVSIPIGVLRCGNLAFALDVDGSTEPFTALYDISQNAYREQVANSMGVSRDNISNDLLVLNGINSSGAEPIDSNVITQAINKIEHTQTLDVGVTGYFTESNDAHEQAFISILLECGFQKLNYDGFVRPSSAMFFRPQSAYR